MQEQKTPTPAEGLMSRRGFITSAAAAGAGLALTRPGFTQSSGGANAEPLRIALIGAGSQGRVLMNCCLKIPGIQFVALCDIWEYHQRYGGNILKKYGHEVTIYEDYRRMLDEQAKNLDAVLVATPDWMHPTHAIASMEAGLHVFCEKEMSNRLDTARRMVEAQRRTGRLLQFDHQRRSNPYYRHALKLIYNDKVLGRITTVNGQWNRPVQAPRGWPDKYTLPEKKLAAYGYGSMTQFRNWRWYKKYAGGPIVDLGSHQLDVYNWFLRARPSRVFAMGGVGYYADDRQWYDNVMVLYEYNTPQGTVQASYQVNNTTSHGGYYETFMGDAGSIVVSEDVDKCAMFREAAAKRRQWEDESEKIEKMGKQAIELKIGETRTPSGGKPKAVLKAEQDVQKPLHQPHLENFFEAIRTGAELHCPPEIAWETAVTVLKVNESIARQQPLEFKAEEFEV